MTQHDVFMYTHVHAIYVIIIKKKRSGISSGDTGVGGRGGNDVSIVLMYEIIKKKPIFQVKENKIFKRKK